MKEIINTLEKFADDAIVQIYQNASDSLVLRVEFPSRGNEKWDLRIEGVVHLDMNTELILGSTAFGQMDLLPDGYVESRNFDYGLTSDKYHVIKFIDIDLKLHFITYLGNITFFRVETALPAMTLEHLLGKRALETVLPKDYIDWAQSLLYEDVESTNVSILAGLGIGKYPDSNETELYFQKALADLDIPLPPNKESLKIYARALCQSIVSGELAPEAGLGILKQFYMDSDYETIYQIWDGLGNDLEMIKMGGPCFYNTGLTLKNINAYIQNAASQFIIILDSDLPEDFFELRFCPECGYLGESGYARLEKVWMPEKLFRYLYNRGRNKRVICARCKAPNPRMMFDYTARKQYLEAKG